MYKIKEFFNKIEVHIEKISLFRLISKHLNSILLLIFSILILDVIHYLIIYVLNKVPLSVYVSYIYQSFFDRDNINFSEVEKYKINDSTILIGALTIWIAVLTIWIQRISREQDIVNNFPEISVNNCYFYFSEPIILNNVNWLFKSNCEMAIKIKFNSAFTRFFEPEIYRMWIVKRRRNQYVAADKSKIGIIKSDSEIECNCLCVGVVSDKIDELLNNICRETWNDDLTVELIIDMRWRNYKKTALYLRNFVVLNQKPIQVKENIYCCSIRNRKIIGSPMFLWKW